jgi:acetyl esterase/lipase
MQNADAVYIHAHGGGMAIGHPLQYLEEYRRWVKLAAKRGKSLVILAPAYPLSPQQKWPGQRDAVAGLYTWILSKSLDPSRILLGGDSAGADLALLYLIFLRDHSPTTPLPSAVVLHSPSIDMTASQTQFTPRIKTDFMFAWSDAVLFNNDMIRPEGLPFDTPEISALLANDVSGLPPQLVFYSATEVLASDSQRWIERSRKAGVKITEFRQTGELHTFSLGGPFVGKKLQDQCDEVFIEFIFKHV